LTLIFVEQKMSVMAVDVLEAARRLRVSPERVRQLIAAGDLAATRIAGRHVLDEDTVDELAERTRPAAVRAFSRRLAWAAAALVDGEQPGWVSQSELSRLRRRLRDTDRDVDAWRTRLKARAATTRTYRVAAGNVRRLLRSPGVARSGVSARGLVTDRQISADTAAGWLAHADDLVELTRRFAMLPSDQGNVLLRVADVDGMNSASATTAGKDRDAYRLIVAADLLESSDARTSRAGRALLHGALDEQLWLQRSTRGQTPMTRPR
jgi:excisionase family DNA binding protein